MVTLRVVLRSPLGDTVVRDVAQGHWDEPTGEPERTIGGDMWALPGLVDAHSHLAAAELDYHQGDLSGAEERARASLRAGVALLLDKGWADDTAVTVIDSVPPGERPDIEAAARVITAIDGHIPGFAREVDPGELEQAVKEEAAVAAGWVKMFGDWPRKGRGPVANFTEEELRAAVAAAEAQGAKVAVHTMARDVPSMAVAAGVHSIEHGMFLEEGDLDLLGARSGMWVPTVLRCQATLAQLGEQSSGGKLFLEGIARLRRSVPLGVEAGVHLLAGTDLIGSPADVAAEAIELRSFGLSNDQVVRAVAVSGHLATGRDTGFSPGEPANAVFFPADPIAELEVLRHPSLILRLGKVVG